jgi:hypothetical protein
LRTAVTGSSLAAIPRSRVSFQTEIREFLSEVEKAAAENPAKKTDNLSDWLSWAHAYAESIDPIHLTFHSAARPENNNDEV